VAYSIQPSVRLRRVEFVPDKYLLFTVAWNAQTQVINPSATRVAQAQVVNKKVLTLAGAKTIIASAVAAAKQKKSSGGAIAVVDDGGNLIALERLDNTFGAAAHVSIGKARTAAIFKHPTKFLKMPSRMVAPH
jgi:hypothetical protein